jgi:hypothetical protein
MRAKKIETSVIVAYASITAIKRLFGVKRNKTEVQGFIPFTLTLSAMSPSSTEVKVEVLGKTDLRKVQAHVERLLGGLLTPPIDHEMLRRLTNIIDVYPNNRFVIGMIAIVNAGKPLHPNQLAAIEKIEAQISSQLQGVMTHNPSLRTQMVTMSPLESEIQEALKVAPGHPFLESLAKQVAMGKSLSARQLAALRKFTQTPSPDKELEARVQVALEKSKTSFLEGLLKQIQSGKALSPRQMSVLEKIENEPVKAPKALPPVISPNNQVGFLTKVLNLGYPSAQESFIISHLLKKLQSGMELDPNESKTLRHVFYKSHKKFAHRLGLPLDPNDYKAEIRALFP